jgi:predicted metal-dependent phosphoesterase TrpH
MTINRADLHTHSTASDGLYAPSELLKQAHEAGLEVLALTDHDSTNGIPEAQEAAQQYGIDLIPGIEINTDINGKEVHVLGYFIDFMQPAFQASLQTLRNSRVVRAQRMVEKLRQQGFDITWERVREIAKGTVGRPHIAEALREKGYVSSVAEAFGKYISSKSPAYVPRYKLAPEDAIRLIASANGLAVMAHPITYPGIEVLKQRLSAMQAAGLVGLETYYGPYTPDEVTTLKSIADENGLIPTGGSDYHGPGIHPTPLGGRYVPYEAVERLKAARAQRQGHAPRPFQLPSYVEES